MTNNIERKVLDLVAIDRVFIPASSFDNKLKRRREKAAEAINPEELGKSLYFEGERAHARVEYNDTMKARGMKEGIAEFSEQYPRHGKILQGLIEEQRAKREVSLYFGVNEGKRLTADDYIGVMMDLGLTQASAEKMYPGLMEVSRNLSKKRDEERSILIG